MKNIGKYLFNVRLTDEVDKQVYFMYQNNYLSSVVSCLECLVG